MGAWLPAASSASNHAMTASLYDADDNLLSDWSMVDTDSGTLLFNADGRQAPVLPPVPEPGTWSMMLGGLLSMGWMRRRRVGVRAES